MNELQCTCILQDMSHSMGSVDAAGLCVFVRVSGDFVGVFNNMRVQEF